MREMPTPAVKMHLLRGTMAVWILLSFVLPYVFSIGDVGFSAQWKNGKSQVSASSHPVFLVWSVIGAALFLLLMNVTTIESPAGIPSMKRRFLAFLIDFWFSLMVLTSLEGMLPLWLEGVRTGHFSWQFERDYSVPSDAFILFPLVLSTMSLMLLYFVWPLTKGKQTVGGFILRLRVAPPFGNRGAFTFREAVRRIWFEFRGISPFSWLKQGRDSLGRTWYDRETNCQVILIKYE